MTKMKKFILSLSSIVLFCCTGCVGPKSCEAYAQCDELYMNDYNCVRSKEMYILPHTTHVEMRNVYPPAYNTYRDYYPNTQTVYYYPVVIPQSPVLPHTEQRPERSKKRPGSTTRNSRNR